jgi:hypothetical protein
MAGTKYMSGGPDLTASISGSNEFSPGDDVTINVKIENKGLIDIKFVQSGIVETDDLPNTAKLVTVGLEAGDAPLVIKSDPQMIGDIAGGKSVQVSFAAKVNSNAQAGTYNLPLRVRYTYLSSAEQQGQDSITYIYKDNDETIVLPVKIQSDVYLGIVSATPEHLNVGNEGYVNLKVLNTGYEDAESAIIKISRNGNSPLIPTDSSVYIGDFPRNGTVDCRFKVSVSRDATSQTYPLDVFVVYKDHEGDTRTSDPVTVGIPVGGKISFEVASEHGAVTPGQKKVIEVEYRNIGDATAYNAQARISAVDPFTSNDDTAYLGDLAPGQTVIARYEVSVDGSATLKEYGLDSEIRYRDALDNSQISDTMKVRVKVVEGSGPVYTNPVVIIAIIAVLCGAGYYVFVMRKKK